MRPLSTQRMVHWIVCEQSDRWYRAVCRFAPELIGPEHTLRVERTSFEAAKQVVALAKAVRGVTILCWEFPLGLADYASRLEPVATIRFDSPDVLQIACLPSTASPELLLWGQEAGLTIFLQGPEALQQAGEIVTRHVRPLG